jgi:DNA primase
MSRIPQGFIDELIARADIVEIVGLRVPLKKSGREYKACCPFHSEKTPSFWVSPDKQFYHCFGCAAHGTALGFLMAYDRLSFPEAIEELAARVGLEVPREADPRGRRAAPCGRRSLQAHGQRGELLRRSADARQARARLFERARPQPRTPSSAIRRSVMRGNSWNEVLQALRGAADSGTARQLQRISGLIIEREGGQMPA